MQETSTAEVREEARVVLFKDGDIDKAVPIICEGDAAKFVQDVSDMVIDEAESGCSGDFLAGVYYSMTAAPDGEKQIRGVAHGAHAGTLTALLASMIADCAVRHSGDPKRFCGVVCDTALAAVRCRLMEERKSPGGVLFPDTELRKGGSI